jgi:predicted Zn-dependent peptidase
MMKPQFYKKILANGMTVLYEERKNSGVVSVAFAVKHGGIHENKEEKGISHFIEHLLYKGTKKRAAKQISEDIERNGGILNGFTEEEFTAFWCKMPSKHIEVALDVLSDMLLNSVFDEKEMNKERHVIFEEMKMRRDRPDIFVVDKVQSLLFTGSLALDSIGTEESLSSINREKILDKFKKVYGSENLILCVVGDANFKSLCNFCEKNFKKSNFQIGEPKIGLKNGENIFERVGIDQANMIFAYHAPKAGEKGSYAAQTLNCLMAGGMSSRLFQEIREKRNLAYALKGNYSCGKRYGYGSVFVGTSPENMDKVKKILIEEFEKIKTLKEKELNQVKEQLIGNSKISREDSQGQMLDLLYNEIWTRAEDSYQYEDRIKQVKIEDLKKIASFKKYSFIALVPKKK